MAGHPLDAADLAPVAAARRAIALRRREGWHAVGAALRTRSGRVFTGVHLEASVGRIAVCAEAVALGRAATEAGDADIAAIVAAYHPGGAIAEADLPVAAPFGMCREVIADYAPGARVVVPDGGGGTVMAGICPKRSSAGWPRSRARRGVRPAFTLSGPSPITRAIWRMTRRRSGRSERWRPAGARRCRSPR